MRYLLFGGQTYHPLGGAADLLGLSDDLSELQERLVLVAVVGVEAWRVVPNPHEAYDPRFTVDWWHIIDITTRRVVSTGGYQHRRMDFAEEVINAEVYDEEEKPVEVA